LEQISDFTKTEITEFWENKVNGALCTDLFHKIIDNYDIVVDAIQNITDWVDKYNRECSDKCLPGYVKCEGDYTKKCVKECDCCAQHNLYCCKSSDNHPYSDYNYATGDGEVLRCYDWCCEEDATYCGGDCVPDHVGMPYGYGPSSGPA